MSETYIFWHEGDSSVGLDGDSAALEIDLSWCDDGQDKEILEGIRSVLEEAWDFRTKVNLLKNEIGPDSVEDQIEAMKEANSR